MTDTRQPIHRTVRSWAFTLLLAVVAVTMSASSYQSSEKPKAQAVAGLFAITVGVYATVRLFRKDRS